MAEREVVVVRYMTRLRVSLTNEKIVEAVTAWIGALDTFLKAMRGFTASRDEAQMSRKVIEQLGVSRDLFDNKLAEWSGVGLDAELDNAIDRLVPGSDMYVELVSLRAELYRLLSEAKVVVASVAIAL